MGELEIERLRKENQMLCEQLINHEEKMDTVVQLPELSLKNDTAAGKCRRNSSVARGVSSYEKQKAELKKNLSNAMIELDGHYANSLTLGRKLSKAEFNEEIRLRRNVVEILKEMKCISKNLDPFLDFEQEEELKFHECELESRKVVYQLLFDHPPAEAPIGQFRTHFASRSPSPPIQRRRLADCERVGNAARF